MRHQIESDAFLDGNLSFYTAVIRKVATTKIHTSLNTYVLDLYIY